MNGDPCMKKFDDVRNQPWFDLILRAVFFASFGGITVMLFWKCRYGFGDIDEAFYLTIPYRFVQGDRIVLHEWHMTQFAGFTMIPIMWLYRIIAPSTEGIILTFRYVFTSVWATACLFFEQRLRKIHRIGAGFVSLILLTYAPYGVMALSYNSLALLYLMNAVVFFLNTGMRQKLQFCLSGFFFAGAVLCCPFLISLYVFFCVGLLVIKMLKKTSCFPIHPRGLFSCWFYFTLGAVLLATIFLGVLFNGASIQQIIKSLTLALQDPEHEMLSFAEALKDYCTYTVMFNGYIRPLIAGLLVVILISLVQRRAFWLSAVCAMVAIYLWTFVKPGIMINYLMYPLSFAGVYVMSVTKNSKIRWIGWVWFVPGLIGTVCFSLSSNQGFYAISHGATIPSLASVMMLWMYCDELKEVYRAKKEKEALYLIAPFAVLSLLVYLLGAEITARYENVFWEQGLMESKSAQVEIAEGPEKGVIVFRENEEDYLRTYHDVAGINHQKVLFLSYRTWLPLVNENENAAFSAWLSVYKSGMNRYTLERLEAYYQLCPEKRPEVIFLDRKYADLLEFFENEAYMIRLLDGGNYLIHPVLQVFQLCD